ncbi:MAG: signal recognition particle subunit SRP19/SEC65 family protein [Thermoplasmata archaeon]|nr:signal recognition particle subunit SRP19/SEC65 family protein [Thermoplasmata archaeon]
MPDHFYVYPAYLLKSGSRALGRRVPTEVALPEVNVDQIMAAASSLGYRVVSEPDKQYPRQFYRYSGRVKVVKKAGVSKAKFLRELAETVRRRAEAGKA